MSKVRVATVWLDGCSGCHMSFLDQDERLIELAASIELVHSPVVDPKEFPEGVDVAIVEGAVSSDEDLHKIKIIRERSKILVSLGDCAVTANVPAMRNPFKIADIMKRAYGEFADFNAGTTPTEVVPALLTRVRPLHEVVEVDVFLPGCPPPADAIHYMITELLAGRIPGPSHLSRFGS